MELAAEELDEWWDSAIVSKKKSESSHCKAIDDSDLFFVWQLSEFLDEGRFIT